MSEHKRKVSTAGPVDGSEQPTPDHAMHGTAVALVKRPKTDNSTAMVVSKSDATAIIKAGPKRTSGMQAPIMHLTGHGGEVTTCRFSPSGKHLASGSADTQVFLWNTYSDCANYGVLR
ncbi:hypothetical protein GGI13_002653, partial [Coemansia sp. RSA 455]